jgi:hypothetical protein
MQHASSQDFLPVLSPGRHRSARRGACFMEYASFMAGLRWSDHPACTHPTLAALARLVNDLSSDGARSRLAMHVPSVIGLTGDDPRVPVFLATLAAGAALPVASESRQRALAIALVRCERLMNDWSQTGANTDAAIERARLRIRVAFMMAPGTADWAAAFLDDTASRAPLQLMEGDQSILRMAVLGIADACVRDADARLENLLTTAIRECAELLCAEGTLEGGRDGDSTRRDSTRLVNSRI